MLPRWSGRLPARANSLWRSDCCCWAAADGPIADARLIGGGDSAVDRRGRGASAMPATDPCCVRLSHPTHAFTRRSHSDGMGRVPIDAAGGDVQLAVTVAESAVDWARPWAADGSARRFDYRAHSDPRSFIRLLSGRSCDCRSIHWRSFGHRMLLTPFPFFVVCVRIQRRSPAASTSAVEWVWVSSPASTEA